MKKPIIMAVVFFFLLGLISVAVSAPPAGKITIKLSGKKECVFDHTAHEAHAKNNCQTCHHKDAKGSEQKCTICHTAEGKDGASPGKKAFHANCGSCHKLEGKGPQYPKDCKACHGG